MEKIILNTKYFVLYTFILLLPFFFLKTTQEFFVTNKIYLLGFGVLLLLLISTIQLIFSKKISWKKSSFDGPIVLFLTSVMISTLFSSPNKIQALLNPNFGSVMMIFLAILYFYVSRSDLNKGDHKGSPLQILSVVSVLLSVITIILYFILPGFSPVGSQLDLAILLGFFLIIQITYLLTKKQSILHSSFLILNFLALFLTVYSLVKPAVQTPNLGVSTLILPPFRLSWFAALEIFKNPLTAVIGVGPDNFSTVFTKIKDFSYNQSPLWQINSFNVSRSAILQILTETGILGLLTFGLLVFTVFKQLIKGDHKGSPLLIYLFSYLIICLFILPSSLIIWFLFFVTLGLTPTDVQTPKLGVSTMDLNDIIPIYLGIIIISFGLIGASIYFLGRSYASEYFFKKSIDGAVVNSAKLVYDNQRQAIILNPYIERFRSNFAQTNLLIANGIIQKNQTKKISEQDRQTITQAVQASITEAKTVVSLNPQKADNWYGLAQIYLNIINAAAGADVWTISAYQRAILADPQNPVFRVSLGGVYYSQNKYDDALRFFEQAISLKPDWSNAHYNLAWAYFRNKDYQKALLSMQNSINLINKNKFPKEWSTANRDFELFKKELKK